MTKKLNIRLEKAVRLLTQYLPISDETSRKPILFHDIRVGVYLYENGYSDDVILAGILHDAIEFSKITKQMLKEQFGENVTKLVLACTKDDSIKGAEEKTIELIMRCVKDGQNALIVKAADIIDSFKFYTSENNKEQLEYCKRNATAILKHKPSEFNDLIFDELSNWIE